MRPAASGARKAHGAAAAARGGGAGGGAGQSQRKQGAAVKAAQQCGPQARQDPDEEDTNAGFGKYLRSQEGRRPTIHLEEQQQQALEKGITEVGWSTSKSDLMEFFHLQPDSGGTDMMKLFVIANTIVVFMTMAWPQMQQSYQILRSLLFAEDEDEDDL